MSPAYFQWEFPTIDEIGYFGQHRFVKVLNKFSYDGDDGKLHHHENFCFTEGLFHHTRARICSQIFFRIFFRGSLPSYTREDGDGMATPKERPTPQEMEDMDTMVNKMIIIKSVPLCRC